MNTPDTSHLLPAGPPNNKLMLAVFGQLISELGQLSNIAGECVARGPSESETSDSQYNNLRALYREMAHVDAAMQLMREFWKGNSWSEEMYNLKVAERRAAVNSWLDDLEAKLKGKLAKADVHG